MCKVLNFLYGIHLRLNIVVPKEGKRLLFVQEIGTIENNKFEPIGLGLAINPDINKTPSWFKELFFKAMKTLN